MIARVVGVLWAGSVGGSGRLARGAVELVGDVGGAAVRLAGRVKLNEYSTDLVAND